MLNKQTNRKFRNLSISSFYGHHSNLDFLIALPPKCSTSHTINGSSPLDEPGPFEAIIPHLESMVWKNGDKRGSVQRKSTECGRARVSGSCSLSCLCLTGSQWAVEPTSYLTRDSPGGWGAYPQPRFLSFPVPLTAVSFLFFSPRQMQAPEPWDVLDLQTSSKLRLLLEDGPAKLMNEF